MDETSNNNDFSVWAMSHLGFAIDSYVDRRLNDPQVIVQSGAAYGIDGNGQLYQVGQPTSVSTVRPVAGTGSSMLIIVLALAFVASRHGH